MRAETIQVAMGAVGVGGLLLRRHFPAARTPRTDRARWATRRDRSPLAVPAPVPGRLTLGTAGRQLLAAEPRHSVCVFGPTGSGNAADTHLHADFLIGGVDLAAGGAQLLASASGARRYPHTGLYDGDEVDLGGLTLRALGTPGHTEEHLPFLLLDGTSPLGVFTGGSLIVGSAARTDLVHPDRTDQLARAQWRSLQRLAALPEEVQVWPTHGGRGGRGGRRAGRLGAGHRPQADSRRDGRAD